jgi:hypothetical protein
MEQTVEQHTQHRTDVLTRLRFALGERVTEAAVPPGTSLGEALAVVFARFGDEAVESGVEHEGWVVCRDGDESPFGVLDEDRTPAELGLPSGTLVRVRPRVSGLSPIDYDDVVDGVAERVRDDPGAWTPPRTRRMLLAGATAAFGVGAAVLLGLGIPVLAAALAGTVALLLVVGAALVARALADALTATILAGLGAAYAATAGWLVAAAFGPAVAWPAYVVGAGGGALVALAAGLFAVADSALLFAGAIAALLPLVIAGVLPGGIAAQATAGLIVVLLLGVPVGWLAIRLGASPMPLLPALEPPDHDGSPVAVDHARAVVGYGRAVHVGNAIAAVMLLASLVFGAARAPASIAAAAFAVVALVRAWQTNDAGQRWALAAPALVAGLVAANGFIPDVGGEARLPVLWLPLALVTAGLFVAAATLPGRRLWSPPPWARHAIGAVAAAALAAELVNLLCGGKLW